MRIEWTAASLQVNTPDTICYKSPARQAGQMFPEFDLNDRYGHCIKLSERQLAR